MMAVVKEEEDTGMAESEIEKDSDKSDLIALAS